MRGGDLPRITRPQVLLVTNRGAWATFVGPLCLSVSVIFWGLRAVRSLGFKGLNPEPQTLNRFGVWGFAASDLEGLWLGSKSDPQKSEAPQRCTIRISSIMRPPKNLISKKAKPKNP